MCFHPIVVDFLCFTCSSIYRRFVPLCSSDPEGLGIDLDRTISRLSDDALNAFLPRFIDMRKVAVAFVVLWQSRGLNEYSSLGRSPHAGVLRMDEIIKHSHRSSDHARTIHMSDVTVVEGLMTLRR